MQQTLAMAHHQAISMLVLFLFSLEIPKTGASVSAIIVFGDSSVDSGNNNYIPTMARSNFRPYGRDFKGGKPTGRFSNGRLVPDFVSEAFVIKPTVPAYLDPSCKITDFATGVCFASAGSGYDNATSNIFSVIPLWKQLEYYKEFQVKLKSYLGEAEAETVLREALYMISSGTNDFLENYYMIPGRSMKYPIEEYQRFLIGLARDFVTELYKLGSRKISLAGIGPIGCLPLERRRGCLGKYNDLAKEFNGKLRDLVEKLKGELSGIQLVFSDPYDIFFDIIQNPSTYGFENTGMSCCGTGTFELGYACGRYNPFTCTNASTYVFWDSFHPTEKTYSIIAYYAANHSLSVFF